MVRARRRADSERRGARQKSPRGTSYATSLRRRTAAACSTRRMPSGTRRRCRLIARGFGMDVVDRLARIRRRALAGGRHGALAISRWIGGRAVSPASGRLRVRLEPARRCDGRRRRLACNARHARASLADRPAAACRMARIITRARSRHDDAVRALAAAAAPTPVERVLACAQFAAELLAAPRARRFRPYAASCATPTDTRGRSRARSARARGRSDATRRSSACSFATPSRGRRSPREAGAASRRHAHGRRVAHACCFASARHAVRLLHRRRRARDGRAARRRDGAGDGHPRRCGTRPLGHDAVAARTRKSEWRSLMLVRNRAARPRGGIAELEIETFLADVAVGPGSTPPERVRHVVSPRLLYGDAPGATARDSADEPAHRVAAPLSRQRSRRGAPRRRVGPCGAGLFDHAAAPRRREEHDVHSPTRRSSRRRSRSTTGFCASSSRPTGRSRSPRPMARGRSVPRSRSRTSAIAATCTRTRRSGRCASRIGSSVRASFIAGRCEPRSRRGGASSSRPRADRRLAGARREGTGAGFIDIRVRLRLDAGSPFLAVFVDGVNGAAGHRLRVRLRTGVAKPRVWADAAFGPVERVAIVVSERERARDRSAAADCAAASIRVACSTRRVA